MKTKKIYRTRTIQFLVFGHVTQVMIIFNFRREIFGRISRLKIHRNLLRDPTQRRRTSRGHPQAESSQGDPRKEAEKTWQQVRAKWGSSSRLPNFPQPEHCQGDPSEDLSERLQIKELWKFARFVVGAETRPWSKIQPEICPKKEAALRDPFDFFLTAGRLSGGNFPVGKSPKV